MANRQKSLKTGVHNTHKLARKASGSQHQILRFKREAIGSHDLRVWFEQLSRGSFIKRRVYTIKPNILAKRGV